MAFSTDPIWPPLERCTRETEAWTVGRESSTYNNNSLLNNNISFCTIRHKNKHFFSDKLQSESFGLWYHSRAEAPRTVSREYRRSEGKRVGRTRWISRGSGCYRTVGGLAFFPFSLNEKWRCSSRAASSKRHPGWKYMETMWWWELAASQHLWVIPNVVWFCWAAILVLHGWCWFVVLSDHFSPVVRIASSTKPKWSGYQAFNASSWVMPDSS